MRPRTWKRVLIAVLTATLLLVNSGCAQLKEIRAFAALAGDVGDRFPALVRDLYDSCMSQQRYIVAQKKDFRFDKFGDLFQDDNLLMDDGRKQCQGYKDEQDRLIKANATLVAYMKSMGDLAADDLTNFDKNTQGFDKALTGNNLLGDAAATAVTHLASSLLHAATEGYRRKKLRDALKNNNDDVKTLAEALSRIVTRNYVLQLENERAAMRDYYRKLAQESVDFAQVQAAGAQASLPEAQRRDVPNPAPLDELKTAYEAKNAAISQKVAGAQAYAKILDNVAEGHQKLADSADHLNSREALSTALSYAKTIQSLAADFQKAF